MSTDTGVDEPIDPDVNIEVSARRREFTWSRVVVLLVIALGGGLGALARYGVSLWLPTTAGNFPWVTFMINVFGCFLIGVLMVLITEVWSAHRLLRPFLGVGVLGGFTTFSTYAVEIGDLLRHGSAFVGLSYLAGTVVCALLAVLVGAASTRWATGVTRYS